MARKYPKAPKRPKMSASLRTWENYDSRMKEHLQKCRTIDAGEKKRKTIQKKYGR